MLGKLIQGIRLLLFATIAQQFKESLNFPVELYETSALTGENIVELFENMSRRLIIGDDKKEEQMEVQVIEKAPEIGQKTQTESTRTDESIEKVVQMLEELENKMFNLHNDLNEVKKIINDLK